MQTHPSPTQTDNPGLGDLPSVLKFRQLKLHSIPGYSLSALGRLSAFPGAGNPFAVCLTGPCCLKLNSSSDPEDPVPLQSPLGGSLPAGFDRGTAAISPSCGLSLASWFPPHPVLNLCSKRVDLHSRAGGPI